MLAKKLLLDNNYWIDVSRPVFCTYPLKWHPQTHFYAFWHHLNFEGIGSSSAFNIEKEPQPDQSFGLTRRPVSCQPWTCFRPPLADLWSIWRWWRGHVGCHIQVLCGWHHNHCWHPRLLFNKTTITVSFLSNAGVWHISSNDPQEEIQAEHLREFLLLLI